MRRRTAGYLSLIYLLFSIAATACDSATDPILPGTISVNLGDQQSATAGTAVMTIPSVLVKDTKGRPMKGATVSFAVTGGGSVTAPSAVSGPDGVASPGGWVLGTTAGVNTLTATVTGVQAPAVFTAVGLAGAPATVQATSGTGQSATVATAVSVLPTVQVKDAHDNAVSGTTVTFAVTSGGGSITGETATTDANGFAHVGSWQLGTTAGANTLSASVNGVAPAVILATGTAGAASALTLSAIMKPTQVTASVATPPIVVVRDAFQNPVAGVTVTFTVNAGSGTITGATQISDATGSARLGGWTLGTTSGVQNVIATAQGIAPLTIGISALAAAAAQVAVNGGNNQSAAVSTNVLVAPSVIVRDQYNNPVAGTAVTFAVASGGGVVNGGNAATNSNGVAAPNAWQLGPNIGTNTLTATVNGLTPVTFTATGTTATVPPPGNTGGYNITVRYVVPPTARQQLAVDRAVARWQKVITADLTDVPVNIPAGQCGASSPAVNETVDDILIFVDFSTIDGVGKILGQAGPCFIRSTSRLPIMGTLQLDAADLATMETDGTIDDVVLHEIGHILGIGTIWSDKGLLVNATTDSVTFTGPLAGTAFTNSGGVTFPGAPVPVENCVGIVGCGQGTRDSHWRERVMGRELMTGYISPAGTTNPLSRITIQSLADLGYTVDLTAADPYTVSASLRAGQGGEDKLLVEGKPDWIIRTISDRPSKQ